MNDPIMKMNTAQIKQMQERKMRQFFKEQIPFHPFYSKKYKQEGIDLSSIRTIRDLQRLPLTRKNDIVPDKKDPARYKNFILQPTLELIKRTWPKGRLIKLAASKAAGRDVTAAITTEYSPVHMTATSGTTGTNVPFVYTPYDMVIYGRSYARAVELMGIPPGSKIMNVFPFAPHLAFYMVLIGGWESKMFVYNTGGGAVTPTTKAIDLMKKLESEALIGIPSYLYHVCRKALDAGERLKTIKWVVGGGERFPDGLKDRISRMCAELGSPDVRIFDVYGTTEMRTAITSCRPNCHEFHLHPELFIYELVDPETGEQVAEGEKGVLAVTNIDGRGTVVIRYLIGDIFEKGMDTCKCPHCGTCLPRLVGPVGRMKDYDEHLQLTNIKGTLVNLYTFYEVMPTLEPVAEWQVVISKKDNDPYEVDELTLNIAPKAGSDIEAATKLVRDTINSAMEVTPKVQIYHNVDNLFEVMGGQIKPKRILDERPLVANGAAAAGANGAIPGKASTNGPKIAN